MSVGAPGVYCWSVNARDHAHVFGLGSKRQEALKDEIITRELRGLVPLMPGDVMFTGGLFQKYFLHKTLNMSEFVPATLAKFPATNAFNQARWVALIEFVSGGRRLPRRFCITTRVIAHHHALCPELPVRAQPCELKQRGSDSSTPASSASGSTAAGGVSANTVKEALDGDRWEIVRDERLYAVSRTVSRQAIAEGAEDAMDCARQVMSDRRASEDFEDSCGDVGEGGKDTWIIIQKYLDAQGFLAYMGNVCENLESYVDAAEPQQQEQIVCGA